MTNKLCVYVASRYARRDEAAQIAQRLRDTRLFVIVSTWHDGPKDDASSEAKLRDLAVKDADEVAQADIVLTLTDVAGEAYKYGSHHVEFGLGYAQGKTCVLVGANELMFHRLPGVEQYNTLDDFLRAAMTAKWPKVTGAEVLFGSALPNVELKTAENSMRSFTTGATRSADVGKIDYEGFLSPTALEAYGKYMLKNQIQADGTRRDSDNWQKGIPMRQYMKSLLRHVWSVWISVRDGALEENGVTEQNTKVLEELSAALFNVQGFIHELLKKRKGA